MYCPWRVGNTASRMIFSLIHFFIPAVWLVAKVKQLKWLQWLVSYIYGLKFLTLCSSLVVRLLVP